ncbi:DUF2793 domain-containing protein [uncultured Sphingomonas sp.]|uniref:DUF2793 domain-containing protein n=1 Tax=uncultured Sphingomonas sp. TaxID=158754 RepID=UPI0025F85804|nr:DUF2793 domain-containing protein [uncultured Sphingomonas sp.]
MSDTTARWNLPLLSAGQAQKEMFHNEALIVLDGLVQPSAAGFGVNEPPASPVPGQSWIVGPAPSGAWSSHANNLAAWTDGGWRFHGPRAGTTVWVESDQLFASWMGQGWRLGVAKVSAVEVAGRQVVGTQGSAIGDPSGGTVVDMQARAAVSAILAALRQHGLIRTQ